MRRFDTRFSATSRLSLLPVVLIVVCALLACKKKDTERPMPDVPYLKEHGAMSAGKIGDLKMRLPGGASESVDGTDLPRLGVSYPRVKLAQPIGSVTHGCPIGKELEESFEALMKADGFRARDKEGTAPQLVRWEVKHSDRDGDVARVTLDPTITCAFKIIFFSE